MESGQPICRLAASGRRTGDSAYSGWPSPAVQNSDGGVNPNGNNGEHFTLQTAAELTSWGTPRVNDGTLNYTATMPPSGERGRLELQVLGSWATPTNRDLKGLSGAESAEKQKNLGHGRSILAEQVELAAWMTPEANAGTKAPKFHGRGKGNPSLSTQAELSAWISPMVNDATGSTHCYSRGDHAKIALKLPGQALGATSESSPAATASPGASVLNAAMSRWLIGFPQELQIPGWDSCSPNWQSWVTIQNLLDELCERRDVIG
jgi:hypothetical protein